MDIFSERLKKARKDRQLTQRELANLTKMDQGHISRLENGGKGISMEYLHEIAKALGVTVSHLIGEDIREDRASYQTNAGSPSINNDSPAGLRELANDPQLTAALNISAAEWQALKSIQLANEVSKDGYVQLLITIRAVTAQPKAR
ncbi:MAG TPA: helix-turn-helix domain-containing protein [Candidatus Tenderia electrophaga]|uniref:Helix-turn-helix domain-containing protein n=1 Tax=Candidatus Tenderia electrophaga TaxID=1748243 RepID=A0A832J6S2_9GAMM|nr:helix-turn-helix domain-containing protein [Candidatus Tenderia electrophaga]